jgi:ABC-type dipeptide/oligopeptide/nickel transport system permease component
VLAYAARRLAIAVPTLFAVSLVMYAILFRVGDPVAALRGTARLDPREVQAIIHDAGYDRPLLVQYGRWLRGFVSGDWQRSIENGQPVLSEIGGRLPATLELMGIALLLMLALSLPIGIVGAARRGSAFDQLTTGFAYLGYAIPAFLLGLLLQIAAVRVKETGWGVLLVAAGAGALLAGMLGIRRRPGQLTAAVGAALVVLGALLWSWRQGDFLVYTAQRFSPFASESVWSVDHLQHLVLPVLTLAVVQVATWSRFLRASMLDALGADYVRTARAKGLPPRSVIGRHAFRNALVPLITVVAIDAAALFSGAVVTEQVFAWPGIGTRFLHAVEVKDIPVAMGIVMVGAIAVVTLNLLADIAYSLADPRIRLV